MTANQTPLQLITMKKGSGRSESLLEGRAEVGGKAQGLLSIRQVLSEVKNAGFEDIQVDIPAMTVIGTSVFDAFMERNQLADTAFSNLPDDRIANAFQRADMPFEILGELRRLVEQWTTPLAVRSSGLLEDTTQRPFAGVYLTKMIPNNSHDPDIRFYKLIEAVKFVWASTYFKIAKDYCKATNLDIREEKMAVVIQEMVGKRHYERFYPELSGVARSFNYYPVKPARPEDGVVNLALGLGKTIVDGSKVWVYSPAFPEKPPPYKSPQELLQQTQTVFWSVNLGEPPEYNPIKETEYMRLENLAAAERDGALHHLASTFDLQSERLTIGTGTKGPRALTFAPLLSMNEIPLNSLVKHLLARCEEVTGSPVEIEFAMTLDPPRFGFLQVRPMVVPSDVLQLSREDMASEDVVIASDMALGNGVLDNIEDVVYVIPNRFDLQHTRQIADELEELNQTLLTKKRPYLLIVFGRLGTFDPWLGIPVTWGQVCGAKVIVEATQENVRVEPSQGSHYFHNIVNLGIKYFSLPFSSPYRVNWDWLEKQQVVQETSFARHVRLDQALCIKVDGRNSRGVIFKQR
jgi:hypothetical protein